LLISSIGATCIHVVPFLIYASSPGRAPVLLKVNLDP
jgi:hypothetical protein